jgi:hypothetical protein
MYLNRPSQPILRSIACFRDCRQEDYLYDNVPQLHRHWPPGYNVHAKSIALSTPVPGHLEEVFPEQYPEDRPATVYYSAQGERREYLVLRKSSRGAGPDFQVPPGAEGEGSHKERHSERSRTPPRGRASCSRSTGPSVAGKLHHGESELGLGRM